MSMILGLKLPKKILTLFSKWRIMIMRQLSLLLKKGVFLTTTLYFLLNRI